LVFWTLTASLLVLTNMASLCNSDVWYKILYEYFAKNDTLLYFTNYALNLLFSMLLSCILTRFLLFYTAFHILPTAFLHFKTLPAALLRFTLFLTLFCIFNTFLCSIAFYEYILLPALLHLHTLCCSPL